MNIYTIIPVFNRIEYTKKIINCLRKQTIKNKLKIIVVDDGSTDGTDDWLKEQNDIKTLKGNGRLLWAGAINLAIKYLSKKSKQNDWLLLINNDVEIKNDYVEILYEIAQKNYPAAVGSVIKNKNEELISIGAKIFPKTFQVKDIYNNKFNFQKLFFLKDVDVLSGRGVLYPLKSIFEVKGLRPKIIPHYFADYDLSIRVSKKGYSLIISMKAAVYTNEDFNIIKEKRRKENKIFKLFAEKSTSLWHSKFIFWWEASSYIERITLPFRIIKFIIKTGLRKTL
tara:strand:+ start:400 stop:1245 length:846 start_codon:yes stop_codon:yes gene_type:complete